MIPKSGYRFSEKIMLKQNGECERPGVNPGILLRPTAYRTALGFIACWGTTRYKVAGERRVTSVVDLKFLYACRESE